MPFTGINAVLILVVVVKNVHNVNCIFTSLMINPPLHKIFSLSLPLSPSTLPYSPRLSIVTAQVILVFIIELHDDHGILCHTKLWAPGYSLLQQREVTSCVSPAQVETLQRECVPETQMK